MTWPIEINMNFDFDDHYDSNEHVKNLMSDVRSFSDRLNDTKIFIEKIFRHIYGYDVMAQDDLDTCVENLAHAIDLRVTNFNPFEYVDNKKF